MEFSVLDANGNVIATASKALDTTGNYTQSSETLNYGLNSAKASKLSVIFRSTNAGNKYLNKNDIPKHTGVLGILNDYYVGSQLYIDDIALEY